MARKLSADELKKLVLDSFAAEKEKSVERGKKLIHPDFAVTEMCEWSNGELFPRSEGEPMRKLMREVYATDGREFQFINTAANAHKQTVMVEFIESYPDPETGKLFRTPQIAVCEIKDSQIYRTRHYLDPRLWRKYLSQEQIDKALG